MEMKKLVILFYTVFLSLLVIGQTPLTISTLQLLTNTEHVIDSFNHSGDNCQEEHFTKTNTISILIPLQNYVSHTVSLNTIPGIPPILLQPPQ